MNLNMFQRIRSIVKKYINILIKSSKSKTQILKLAAINEPLFKNIMNDILKDSNLANKRFEILTEIIQNSVSRELLQLNKETISS